ncbi:hypothetical protein GGR27_003698 [Lewinella antarctica]|uniref:Uncharacterized protein n=1 Tax=Neolewinella antarctica TaxID=442734 RepID=A0ABX0XG40_9BACT|nr:hypothetical protein [Neolewinella antarctica]
MPAASPVNRLSIGTQSFFEEDLRSMNRALNLEKYPCSNHPLLQHPLPLRPRRKLPRL